MTGFGLNRFRSKFQTEKDNLAIADSYYGNLASIHQENLIMQKNQYEDLIAKLREQVDNSIKTIALQEQQYNENINMYANEIAAKDIKLKDTEAKISSFNQNINNQIHEIDLLKEEITNLKQKLITSENALTDMATSISWKVTKPLRDMRKNIKNVDK